MIFQPADAGSLWFFRIFSIVMLLLIVRAFSKAQVSRSVVVAFLVYLLVFSGVTMTSLPYDYVLPVTPLLFASVFIVSFWISFSNVGLRIATALSFTTLVGFQIFRLPLEILLHHWGELGTVPVELTWNGQNWDVITGVVSLLAAPVVKKSRALVIFTQLVGLVLLMNVIRVAIMSSPLPFAWPLGNPLQLIMNFPYSLIGPLFVGAALVGHLVTLRKLGLVNAKNPSKN